MISTDGRFVGTIKCGDKELVFGKKTFVMGILKRVKISNKWGVGNGIPFCFYTGILYIHYMCVWFWIFVIFWIR